MHARTHAHAATSVSQFHSFPAPGVSVLRNRVRVSDLGLGKFGVSDFVVAVLKMAKV